MTSVTSPQPIIHQRIVFNLGLLVLVGLDYTIRWGILTKCTVVWGMMKGGRGFGYSGVHSCTA